ncbi:hypothetical protein [Parvicella tangerina]|uniref:Uncharacterized protein n=1 Tax=Parvicella tangerina TaxID=2829795 RepID=A0A916NBH8_9FLAO|nr:hypothetical protein [Parvicella tangerina]CAG5080939.1 hypothetical protein CRYO30217_01489 [Parvicella tangerina]
MALHEPYEKRLGHTHDFVVKYRFFSIEEGGRNNTPMQGYRSDFWYKCDDQKPNQLYMIWPEFLDDKGNLIMNKEIPVPKSGTANMWVINPQFRPFHKSKIHEGLVGYFMEGSCKVAICEVISVDGLRTNPTE